MDSCRMCFPNTYYKKKDNGSPTCIFNQIMLTALNKVKNRLKFKNISYDSVEKLGEVGECIMTFNVAWMLVKTKSRWVWVENEMEWCLKWQSYRFQRPNYLDFLIVASSELLIFWLNSFFLAVSDGLVYHAGEKCDATIQGPECWLAWCTESQIVK